MNRITALTACALLVSAVARPAGAVAVSGTLLYDKIPATVNGLDLANLKRVPAGGVQVELLSEDRQKVLARGVTDDGGNYRLEDPGSAGKVVLRAAAQMGKIRVADLKSGKLYRLVSKAAESGNWPAKLVIPDHGRLSGPFNILAAIRQANQTLAQIDSSLPLDEMELTIFWNTTNDNELQTSYFRPSENKAYILGDRDVDSDEFDDSVILHEYAHYLFHRFATVSEWIGGPHHDGDRLDPRTAWNEGFASFFAQAVLRTPIYIDTLGPGGQTASALNLDEDVPEFDDPGYWSELSVQTALWDLFADGGAEGQHLGLGLEPIWRVVRRQFSEQAFGYLITMADGLVDRDRDWSSGVTEILGLREIAYSPGLVPPVKVPFPSSIMPGVTVTGSVDSVDSRRHNLLSSAHYYQFRKETDAAVKIRLRVTGSVKPDAADLMLVIYDAHGKIIHFGDDQQGVGSLEQFEEPLPAGTYTVGVWSFIPGYFEIKYGSARYELTAEF